MRIMSNQEIRRMLKIAFHAGENHEWAQYQDSAAEEDYPTFDEWYRKNYE
jgi:hypothetical protein